MRDATKLWAIWLPAARDTLRRENANVPANERRALTFTDKARAAVVAAERGGRAIRVDILTKNREALLDGTLVVSPAFSAGSIDDDATFEKEARRHG